MKNDLIMIKNSNYYSHPPRDWCLAGDVLSGSQLEGAAHAGVLQEWFGEQWWTARAAAQLVAVVIVILPLVILRRVGKSHPQSNS